MSEAIRAKVGIVGNKTNEGLLAAAGAFSAFGKLCGKGSHVYSVSSRDFFRDY
jgi:hypothetical protein